MCDKDNTPIDVTSSDVAKVKVFVEKIEDKAELPKTRDFVIRLKQLTLSEIEKHTEKQNVLLNNTVEDKKSKKKITKKENSSLKINI